MTEMPSEKELFEGRMEDGSQPPFISGELYYHWDKPIPGGRENLSALELDAEKLHRQIDMKHLAQLDKALAFGEALVDAGLAGMKNAAPIETKARGANPGRVTVESGSQVEPPGIGIPGFGSAIQKDSDQAQTKARGANPGRDRVDPQSVGTRGSVSQQSVGTRGSVSQPCEGANPAEGVRPSFQKAKRGSDPGRPIAEGSDVTVPNPTFDQDDKDVAELEAERAAIEAAFLAAGDGCAAGGAPASRTAAGGAPASQLPLEKLLPLAEKGARLIVSASAKRAEIAHRLVERSLALDIRRRFLQDRAVAVVYATLLHLDDQFSKLGFGSWMPFRFPDQWLAFCGVMRRVLAANGLIHSKHADVYRKLLDETPEVEIEGELHERVKNAKTPKNPARCWENRGASNMEELLERYDKEVTNPPHPPPRKQNAPD